MTIQETFEDAIRAFIKEAWIKRSHSPELVANLKRAIPSYEGDIELHYPASLTQFVENVDIDGVLTTFRISIKPVKEL